MAINISGARTDDESELIELAMHDPVPRPGSLQ
jgi:hypothetical protein